MISHSVLACLSDEVRTRNGVRDGKTPASAAGRIQITRWRPRQLPRAVAFYPPRDSYRWEVHHDYLQGHYQ